MENIIAVAVELDNGSRRFFLTWGRIQETVELTPVEELVLRHSASYGLGGKPVKAQVCGSLQEAAQGPYFYEAFFALCQKPIPFGEQYEAWRVEMDKRMQAGKEIYYVGHPEMFSNV